MTIIIMRRCGLSWGGRVKVKIMLTNLYIKNFTIITCVELEINNSMTVLTGETGVGKSILIDALLLCLGNRADTQCIRHDSDSCEITATFDVTTIPTARTWLAKHDFEQQNHEKNSERNSEKSSKENSKENSECILRRTLSRSGRSRCYINERPVPQQALRELGESLVDIHGQHEHQSLLKHNTQCQSLDAYAQHDALLDEVARIYQEWSKACKQLAAIQATEDQEAQLNLLAYQIKELDELDIQPNEIKTLEQQHQRLLHAQRLLCDCKQALALSKDNDSLDTSSHDVSSLLTQILQLLEPLQQFDTAITNSRELFNNAAIQVEEAINELSHYLNHIDLNPERLQEIEERLKTIYDVARKHQVKAADLVEHHQKLATKFQQLKHASKSIEELQNAIEQYENTYQEAANKLTKSRKSTAKKLSHVVSQHIKQLGMPNGEFTVELTRHTNTKPRQQGQDLISFLVTTNPGQSPQPLIKVASGGELSRISLAIDVVTAQLTATPTLIFDEIDTGIGGGTAAIVGKLLRQLGETTQVLCVTHLPQVAAQGHHHFKIEKHVENKTTRTSVTSLQKEEKIQEIARMLGGVTITKQTLAHAKEMVADCQV